MRSPKFRPTDRVISGPDTISRWAEANLFGDRTQFPDLPLTPTQHAILILAIEIISKWERRAR